LNLIPEKEHTMPVKFKKHLISTETFEAAGAFDVDGDGHLDILSGQWWYKGPDFRQRFETGYVMKVGEYFDDFSTIPMDVNGDGHTDVVTGGWFGCTLRWRENPGKPGEAWTDHDIEKCGNVESTRAWDVDRDGELEIVPNLPGEALAVYKLATDGKGRGTGKFEKHVIFEGNQGHGLGFGDISGSGRGDFVLAKGWLEAPEDTYGGKWTLHEEFDLGSASVPVIVADVNGDGLADLIVGQSHAYGLDWWEQKRDNHGRRSWVRHPIDPFCSQYHDLWWADIDGDGKPELVTGKRYRAHNGSDPGGYDDIGIYYFKWNGESFSKEVISFGPPGEGAGCGIHFGLADLWGSGRLDVIAPGKDGLFVFENLGSE
jgi:hypothetical protein